jgi:hypothetical protein
MTPQANSAATSRRSLIVTVCAILAGVAIFTSKPEPASIDAPPLQISSPVQRQAAAADHDNIRTRGPLTVECLEQWQRNPDTMSIKCQAERSVWWDEMQTRLADPKWRAKLQRELERFY